MNTTECIGCGICDGSGVIAVTDIPESRVLVCPAWPADQDEPLAYYWAIEGLGYTGPATMQQRIRDNVLAEVARTKQLEPEPVAYEYAHLFIEADRIRRRGIAALIILGFFGFVIAWAATR